uniref:Macro domain-containing protein n=1 Tax=Poecilia mexicana TaxID=48701 RepID=A0A3B3WKH7_9TELE
MCKIKYVTGDLFSAPNQESLAHCVSEDLRMGKGIAVLFKKNFGQVTALKEQKKLTGECAVLTHDRQLDAVWMSWSGQKSHRFCKMCFNRQI